MYAEEERDFLIEVRVHPLAAPAERQPLMAFSLRYCDIIQSRTQESAADVRVERPEVGSSSPERDAEIAKAISRVTTARNMDMARGYADRGDYSRCQDLMSEAMDTVQEQSEYCGMADSLEMDNMTEQLMECKAGMLSRSMYMQKGKYSAANYAQGHWNQRSNASKACAAKSAYRGRKKQAICDKSTPISAKSAPPAPKSSVMSQFSNIFKSQKCPQ